MLAHRRWILREGGSETAADAIARADLDAADLEPGTRALLDYAGNITRYPDTVTQRDVSELREHGFTDAAIGDAVAVAAHYAIMNRLVDGLGAELPRGMDREIERLGL